MKKLIESIIFLIVLAGRVFFFLMFGWSIINLSFSQCLLVFILIIVGDYFLISTLKAIKQEVNK